MNASSTAGSQAFAESVRLLHRLHALFLEGKQESEEADSIRDDADQPWYQMTGAERERLGALSADLYTISDPLRVPSASPDLARWHQRYEDGVLKEDWEGLLALIREDPGPMSPADLAFARARWWSQLGDPESALLFIDEAARLCPSG